MSSTSDANGGNGGTDSEGDSGAPDLVGQLTRMSDRTSLMVVDATLRALPKVNPDSGAVIGPGFADAAAEVRALARRMHQATRDFQATIREPAE